jgi:hypothetical protein
MTITRRDVSRLLLGNLAAAAAATPQTTSSRKVKHIRAASLGKAVRYPGSHGDLWTATWADDGNVYAASDDTTGIDQGARSNLALNRFSGPLPGSIHGVTVNPMKQFGGWGEIRKEDEAMWKACGLASIDGVLYMTVSRHLNPNYEPWIQQTWDSSIIRSADHGATWTPASAPRLNEPMFAGRTFSTPFFVLYGKDGQMAVDDYIYAVSNDGSWNNGSWMTLGRVPRRLLPRLDRRDWEFVHGYDGKGGLVWQPRHDSAVHIFYNPGRTSMTGIHFIAPLGLYIMPQWHYTHLDDDRRRWKATCFEFYQAQTPWGPWTLFHNQNFEPEGWYNPSIPAKYISSDGKSLWLFVAGDWTTAEDPAGLYGLWMMEMKLDVIAVA